ncbi:histone acetyltransferase KAT6A isoform X2 [Leptidea sinapis]|uniref:histone acetyltransferase KAT6A isoform X2 n=1 Tax=Leptidea sinapis TaxID=189913 RepID=UPI0021258F64|nr:histone acetyltransferase KAT6A isoform X2 [Leptidea sinapis]
MELDVSPSEAVDMDCSDNSSENRFLSGNSNEQYTLIHIPQDTEKSNKHSSKKQSKRRKKSSSHTRPLPRIIVKPLPPPPTENKEWTAATTCNDIPSSSNKLCTMREVLASIPGFSLKPRKRTGKKLSTAAQLQQTREGCIDLETPDSILVNTNIRALLNKHTFSLLPPLYQYKLGQLLPGVDRPSTSGRLSSSSLNNEFYARACLEWQECLSGGEFTPENQQKIKSEAEKEKSKIDPWKLKHFEPFWGEKSRKEKQSCGVSSERPSLKTTIKLRPTASITSSSTVPKVKKSKSGNSKRMRSVGAVTRSSTKVDDNDVQLMSCLNKPAAPVPDLLPLKSIKNHSQGYVECPMEFNFSDSSIARPDDNVSTPVDPLLLPDSESFDMASVKLDESNSPKECEGDKYLEPNNSNSQEGTKRLSIDDEKFRFSKRIKFEENVYDIDSPTFVLNNELSGSCNSSDIESNEVKEEDMVQIEEIYPVLETVDTITENSKIDCGYDYDEQSVSSMSSLKINAHLDNVPVENSVNDKVTLEIEVKESIGVIDKSDIMAIHSPKECGPHKRPQKEEDKVEIYCEEAEKDVLEDCPGSQTESTCEDEPDLKNVVNEFNINDNVNISCPNDDRIDETVKIEKCKDAQSSSSFYDEHFRDAESFILETGGLPMMTTTSEETKYSSQANFMEFTSYMSETNVTAVVTMPMSQTSLPMMEVTNTPTIMSYPDEQDPTKPKNSAMIWKTESDWANNENIITLHNFPNVNTESAKYISEDSKTSLEDVNVNDENYMYKEERDTNYNMESSNSSEGSQSMKEITSKSEMGETMPNLVSSTTIVNAPVNSTTVTQTVRALGKKSKSGKESTRSRSTHKVPPGAVNLERSYQICQAVIQNSPNRDALRNQLRPPPALLSKPPRQPRPPQPVLVRQMPTNVMQHNENVTRCRSVGADESCVCNLRAMILCKKCGAFCHDDCIGSAELCLTCLIR